MRYCFVQTVVIHVNAYNGPANYVTMSFRATSNYWT